MTTGRPGLSGVTGESNEFFSTRRYMARTILFLTLVLIATGCQRNDAVKPNVEPDALQVMLGKAGGEPRARQVVKPHPDPESQGTVPQATRAKPGRTIR